MAFQIIVNATDPEEIRVAITEGQILQDFFIETSSKKQLSGNIYKGLVEDIQASLQAAFINFGSKKNGFLPINEIHPEYFVGLPEEKDTSRHRIQDVISKGQEVLIQVVKEEVGTKGAALTTYLSLPGSYLVLMPGRPHRGISRKIEDEKKRSRLKKILNELSLPEEIGIILRTAGENRTKREIKRDLQYLLRLWENIKKRVQKLPTPSLVYKEQDLGIRVIRDYLSSNVKSIIVDDKGIHKSIKEFLHIISPRHRRIVKLYTGNEPIFLKYGIENEIRQIFNKKVPLKLGGYLIIDQTEALIAIDVNSGKMTREKAQEETAYKVNIDAAAEIPRQLRLRDLGGLVVIDFIDMRDNKYRRAVEKRLKEGFKKDKAKVDVGRISKFGLLEMARQHLHCTVDSRTLIPCNLCGGTGKIQSPEATALDFLRQIRQGLCSQRDVVEVCAFLAPPAANYLLNLKRYELVHLEKKYNVTINIESDPGKRPGEGSLEFLKEEGNQEKEQV